MPMLSTSEREQLIATLDRDLQATFLRWLVREDGGYGICESATDDWGASGWERGWFTLAYALQEFLLERRGAPAVDSALDAVNGHLVLLRAS